MVKDLGLSPAVSPAGELSATEMKLWRMSSTTENGIPEPIRTFQLFSTPSNEIVTCISVNEENDLVVLGCKSGPSTTSRRISSSVATVPPCASRPLSTVR